MRLLCLLGAAVLASAAVASDDEDAKALPESAGKAAVVKMCLECHTASAYRQRRLDHDDWSNMVADMVDRGAQGSETEIAAVVEYLTKNFGKGSKVAVNTAPLGELRMVLGLSTPEAEGVIQYRKDHGEFKEWRDLLKVPGIDPAKVEAKKDLMAF